MISGCISADLGQHPSLKGNHRAIATVAGIVDGSFRASLPGRLRWRERESRAGRHWLARRGLHAVPGWRGRTLRLRGRGPASVRTHARAIAYAVRAATGTSLPTYRCDWTRVFALLLTLDLLAAVCLLPHLWTTRRRRVKPSSRASVAEMVVPSPLTTPAEDQDVAVI